MWNKRNAEETQLSCVRRATPVCKTDFDCTGEKKCCSSWCGAACLDMHEINKEKLRTKIGTCNRLARPNCTDPLVAQRFAQATPCTSDAKCPGNQKCCYTGCGAGRVCTDREVQKKGIPECPVVAESAVCPPRDPSLPPIQMCNFDSECTGNLMCCFDGCYNTCRNTVAQPTQCNLCNNGMNECAADETCCGCGGTGVCQKTPCLTRCNIGNCLLGANAESDDSGFIGERDFAAGEVATQNSATNSQSNDVPAWGIAVVVVLSVFLIVMIVIAVRLGRRVMAMDN